MYAYLSDYLVYDREQWIVNASVYLYMLITQM